MVCLGNICRSPTAHGVMEKLIYDKGLSSDIHVDSAGTGDWYIGESPDSRAVAAATSRGYDISQQTARQVQVADFARFDYILAMDRTNLKDLKALSPQSFHPKLRLLLEFSDSEHESVPDPYYSGHDGFELVLDLVEAACSQLLDTIVAEQALSVRRG
ncbi:MAG: low molecular weight phosphotyrosine protein phosphatase [Pseudomonadales bacterium]|nr:low molecular weight phosphotyrosine protein phosphatase [Pseudomonadales bacterium]